jgi:AraC-like DNA-binding protein
MPDEVPHELLACKRCNQQYSIECGYEPSKHGFCWPCCDEIIEKLFELVEDPLVCRRIGWKGADTIASQLHVSDRLLQAAFKALLKDATGPRE